MVHLADDEIALCAATGTGVAHCPQSNARLGSGIARVPEMLAAGVPVGLAVDGAASNEAADMASEAHACWLLHRADPRRGARRRDTPMPGGDPAALSAARRPTSPSTTSTTRATSACTTRRSPRWPVARGPRCAR